MATDYSDFRNLPHEHYEVLSQAESQELEKRWISVFAAHKKNLRINRLKWEIFTHDLYPNVEGEKARTLYLQQQAADFIILPNSLEWEDAVKIDQLPDLTRMADDYLVFPPNLAWTMAFTHEEGWLGPYFAKHKNYVSLVEENIKLIKKKKAKVYAKKKGWMS